jgi:putative sigma-54 modulation protein
LNIQISGRRLEVTDEIRKYAEERAQRLFRFFERISKVQMTLSSRVTTKGPRYGAEIVVTGPKAMRLVAESTEDLLNAAVDKATDKMERQITRHKEKLREHRREPGRRAAAEAPAEGEEGADGEEAAPE